MRNRVPITPVPIAPMELERPGRPIVPRALGAALLGAAVLGCTGGASGGASVADGSAPAAPAGVVSSSELSVTRTDFGGAVFATYRVCASGHRFYLERDAAELDRGVDWWDATRDAEECWIPVQDAARLLDEARRLIADVGDGELVSGAPVTDLFTDSVALLRPAGAERVGCYWGGATARTVDEVQRCVEGARRLDPDMPRDRLEQCARITSFVIAVRDAVVGHGGAPPPGGPSPPGRSPGQESGGR